MLVDFGSQVGVENRAKIDQKWHPKNDEKSSESGAAIADPPKLKPKTSLKALMSRVKTGDNGTVRWRTLKDMAKAQNDGEELDDALKSKSKFALFLPLEVTSGTFFRSNSS